MAPTAAPSPAVDANGSDLLEQSVLGSRRLSNVLVASVVTTGGLGINFFSMSSFVGRFAFELNHCVAHFLFVLSGLNRFLRPKFHRPSQPLDNASLLGGAWSWRKLFHSLFLAIILYIQLELLRMLK
jgi:hypothetical protein